MNDYSLVPNACSSNLKFSVFKDREEKTGDWKPVVRSKESALPRN